MGEKNPYPQNDTEKIFDLCHTSQGFISLHKCINIEVMKLPAFTGDLEIMRWSRNNKHDW